MDTVTILGVADRVVSTRPSEAWVARGLASCTSLAPAQERLESQVYSDSHVLQHLGVYLSKGRALSLEGRESGV